MISLIILSLAASIAGLFWYKISEQDDDEYDDTQLSMLPDDWEEYKAQYVPDDEYNIHPEA